MQISRTSSLHHKICVVERPTLGKSYSITGITYQGKGARATQPLDKNIVQEIVVIRIGCIEPSPPLVNKPHTLIKHVGFQTTKKLER